MKQMETSGLFDLSHTMAEPLLRETHYPWEALAGIRDFILQLGPGLPQAEYDHPSELIWIAKTARIYPNSYIDGPAIIGPGTEVRPGAFIRGSILVGEGCVVGNSTELKNVLLFDNVQVPHYNYVGDSILGFRAHMGAGAITSNLKQDKSPVSISYSGGSLPTGLKKFGAILGDGVEIGCNSVLNPGTVIAMQSRVYPLSMVRGFVPAHTIHKQNGSQVPIR